MEDLSAFGINEYFSVLLNDDHHDLIDGEAAASQAITQPVFSGDKLGRLQFEESGINAAAKILVSQFVFDSTTAGSPEQDNFLHQWEVEGIRYTFETGTQTPLEAFGSAEGPSRVFLGPTDVKRISQVGFADGKGEKKGLGTTTSQKEEEIESTPFFLLKRSMVVKNGSSFFTLWQCILCIRKGTEGLLTPEQASLFHNSISSKSGSNLKSKNGSHEYKAYRKVSYYFLEPAVDKPNGRKKKASSGNLELEDQREGKRQQVGAEPRHRIIPGSSSAPELSLTLNRDLDPIAREILQIIFSNDILDKGSRFSSLLSHRNLTIDEAMRMQLPHCPLMTPSLNGQPLDRHKNHCPPLLHWPMHPTEAHCYDLDSPTLASSPSSSSNNGAALNPRSLIDVLSAFATHFSPDLFVKLLMAKDNFEATGIHCLARFGYTEVLGWVAPRIKGHMIPMSFSGWFPYHESAKGFYAEATTVCLRMLNDSMQPGENVKDFIFGHDNRWMNGKGKDGKGKNLMGESPNDTIKRAAVELGFIVKDEELVLFGPEAKKLHQLSRLISRAETLTA